MIVADLFAGVGGLSQGFIKAGCEVAFAVEFDKEIAAAYKKNHPNAEVFADDICQLDTEKIKQNHPNIDIVMGGPPCQGFSQKGKRLSLDDPRNFLFQQFVRFVAAFKPKYFVLENVYACSYIELQEDFQELIDDKKLVDIFKEFDRLVEQKNNYIKLMREQKKNPNWKAIEEQEKKNLDDMCNEVVSMLKK